MDFFSKLGETISETGKDVSQKVSDLTGMAKLNFEIRGREEFVQKQYTQIGKQYYELHKDDLEPLFEEIKLITESLAEITDLKAQVAELKGKKRCPACGAVNEKGAIYCNKCGEKCETIFEEDTAGKEEEKAQEVQEPQDIVEPQESAEPQESQEVMEEVVVEEVKPETEEEKNEE